MLEEGYDWGAFALSAAAHLVLLLALFWGVRISSQVPAAVEAELWSSLPQLAAPRPVEPVDVIARRMPQPIQQAEPDKTPDILLEKIRSTPAKIAPVRTEPPKAERAKVPDKNTELKKQQEQSANKAQAERLRQERFNKDVQSLMADAGRAGTAAMNASPKGDLDWVTRTRARIRANAIFSAESVSGNPTVEYAVELDPAGGVLSIRKLRASGLSGFDEAVERAIRKSEPFAADNSGKVPRNFVIQYRLKD
jgi:colicin import membrane protein